MTVDTEVPSGTTAEKASAPLVLAPTHESCEAIGMIKSYAHLETVGEQSAVPLVLVGTQVAEGPGQIQWYSGLLAEAR